MTDLATLQLTYRDVGATAGPLPDGYHHVRKSAVIGTGRARFENAAGKVMRWGMLRGAGDESDRRGFAYGTLPGHPESGEELFAVRYDAATDEVHAEVVAFSRHGTWWSKLGSPVTSLAHRISTSRYLTARSRLVKPVN